MPKKDDPRKPFNLLLSQDEMIMLKELAALSGQSAGSEVRAALRARFSMLILATPCCANGQHCFVPQMHSHLAATAPKAPGQ